MTLKGLHVLMEVGKLFENHPTSKKAQALFAIVWGVCMLVIFVQEESFEQRRLGGAKQTNSKVAGSCSNPSNLSELLLNSVSRLK